MGNDAEACAGHGRIRQPVAGINLEVVTFAIAHLILGGHDDSHVFNVAAGDQMGFNQMRLLSIFKHRVHEAFDAGIVVPNGQALSMSVSHQVVVLFQDSRKAPLQSFDPLRVPLVPPPEEPVLLKEDLAIREEIHDAVLEALHVPDGYVGDGVVLGLLADLAVAGTLALLGFPLLVFLGLHACDILGWCRAWLVGV